MGWRGGLDIFHDKQCLRFVRSFAHRAAFELVDPRERWGARGGEEQRQRRESKLRASERERESRVCVWTRGLLSKVSKAPVGAWLAFEGGRRSPR